MLFKKTICSKCGHEYDELLEKCPSCEEENIANQELRRNYPMVYLSYYRQIGLFVLGLIGFTIFNILFSLIFSNIFKENQNKGTMLISLCSYLLFLIFVIAIIYPHLKEILAKFKGYKPYIVGLIGGVALTGGTILINILLTLFYPSIGQGGNQSGIVNLTHAYPVFAILIFGIVGPICEEFAYRVGLFTFLRRINRVVAYLVAGLIFALIHFDYTSPDLISEFLLIIVYLWAGISLSITYEIGGIAASMTAHILNNVYSLMMILIGVNL